MPVSALLKEKFPWITANAPKDFEHSAYLNLLLENTARFGSKKRPRFAVLCLLCKLKYALGFVLCGFYPLNPREPDRIAVFSQLYVSDTYTRQSHSKQFPFKPPVPAMPLFP